MRFRVFEIPHGMVQLLLGASIAVFALCISRSGTANISPEILFRYGAMYSGAIDRHEFWRLFAHGFLHANPVHLFANMLCLVLWGGLLEARLGALYFTLVYVSGLLAGAIVSNIAHAGPYLSVGASGAISAVLGALLCLRIMRKIDLPWSFFVTNIGFNVALAAASPRIDWGAHLGGFVAGMVSCACLDLVERAIGSVLRCKFPEFVKMNTFIVFVMVVGFYTGWLSLDISRQGPTLLVGSIAAAAVVKLLDLVLSAKKGLAFVVLAFAVINAALVLLLKETLTQALVSACDGQRATTFVTQVCANIDLTLNLFAAIVFLFTMLLYWPQLARGMADVGFVGASFRGERDRRRGI